MKLQNWKKNITKVLIGVFACMLLLGQSVLAARTGSVNYAGTNVRGEASTSGEVVGNLDADVEVAVIDETTGTDGNTWYQVEFTYDGEETTGWMRSDLLTVTGEEDPEEEVTEESTASMGSYSIIEPEEDPVGKDNHEQVTIQVEGNLFTAWQVDTSLTDGAEIFLIYAQGSDGEKTWCYYDTEDESVQKDRGQYEGTSESDGLIESLRTEVTTIQEETETALQLRLYVIIGLVALSVILLVVVIVLGVKLSQVEYLDDDMEESDLMEFYKEPKKKKTTVEKDIPYEDILKADLVEKKAPVRNVKVEEPKVKAPKRREPEIEMPDIELPEIEIPDTDIFEIETPEMDEFDDIEILDWDDLDL